MPLLRAALGLVLVIAAESTGPRSPLPPSRSELLQLLYGGPPQAVPADFECAWRQLAFEYAQQLQPFRPVTTFQDIHDALELATKCNVTFRAPAAIGMTHSSPSLLPQLSSLYVDAVNGNDANSGSEAAPLQHIAAAVAKARTLPPPAQVVLRGSGVHRIASTIVLTAADSGLSLINYPGENPVVSGGTVLATSWKPTTDTAAAAADVSKGDPGSKLCGPNSTWVVYEATDAMYGDWPNPAVVNLSSTADYASCASKCLSYAPKTCQAWIWYAPAGNFGPEWSGQCFIRTDDQWPASDQHDTWSGRCESPPIPPNIFVADLAAGGTPLPSGVTADESSLMTMLFSADGGRSTQRAFRARYPNANLELDLFPAGWAGGGTRLSTACNPAQSNVTHVPLPDNYGPGMFSDYRFGSGGTCDRFGVGEWNDGPSTISYWCQPDGRTAGCDYYVGSPEGVTAARTRLPHAPYTHEAARNGAVVHYWRNGHWFSMSVRVNASTTDPVTNATTLTWTYGAFQGAEGDRSGEDWYIDHVREELDAPREFYFDATTQLLYYNHNATVGTPPPADWTFEVPLLQVLFNFSGTEAAPVTNVAISGITFTSVAATLLAPHGIPSGGDWGLSRLGAILMENVAGVTVSNCTFTRLDGNAIMLSGRTRNVTIDANEFVWLGESAVASWGKTDGVDATRGTQPWFTTMTRNICREIGLYEKQTSCYFAATSASATVTDNIFFNMPRAAINFNDDMAGGSSVLRNLVWNTCRESQDHGPFNSWGRVPYLVNWANGTSAGGLKPLNDEIAYNFIVAGGGANGGSLDHDDGSSFYEDHDNFFVYGGHKSDFDGHAKRSIHNVMAFANVYGSRCLSIMNLPHAAPNDYFAEAYANNTCILAAAGDAYLDLGSGCAVESALSSRIILGGNRVFVPSKSTSVSCGKTYTMDAWLAEGYDVGTTVDEVPPTADIMAMAREVLGMPPA